MIEERFERINTHHNFWNLKTTLYSIEGKVLPIPISSTSVFYYGCIFILVILISKVPGLNLILELPYIENPMVKYIGVPIFIGYFLEHIKLDGKAPYIYLLDIIRFSMGPKVFEHFREVKVPKSKKVEKIVKYKIEEKTSIILKEKVDRKKYRYMHEYL